MDLLVLLAVSGHGGFNCGRSLYAVLDTLDASMDTGTDRLNRTAVNEFNSRKTFRRNGVLVRHDQGHCYRIAHHNRHHHDRHRFLDRCRCFRIQQYVELRRMVPERNHGLYPVIPDGRICFHRY